MNGIIPVDEKTEEYVKARTNKSYDKFYSDPDAKYHSEYVYNAEELVPVVAKPHSPDNMATVKEVEGTPITKAYVGSCTGGKIVDFQFAAKILDGQKVKVSTFIIPATVEVEAELSRVKHNGKTLREIFENAGCILSAPSCAACLGGPEDTIGRTVGKDVTISTTNRNFPGRMGSKEAEVYLASPLTVAASAVTGVITDPRDLM
jgi:3-isopropylmalate/(R)-2-methylmalate dehydratase large subunit